jgi:hypothetical protein
MRAKLAPVASGGVVGLRVVAAKDIGPIGGCP